MSNNLLAIYDSIIIKQSFVEIQKCNEETLEYGLKLSEEDIKDVISTRSEALSGNGRIEFGGGIIKKIISVFCDSPYISQYHYAETLNDLIETFYYYKNETIDQVSDDELIEVMKSFFDHQCQGSMELLKHKYLDGMASNIRFGIKDYLKVDDHEQFEEFEEEEE
jgi:hypothetical protein